MILFKLTGFNKLTEEERTTFDKLTKEYTKKIEQKIKTLKVIELIIRTYHTQGKRKKYSIHAKITTETTRIEVESTAWDIAITTHKLYKKMLEVAETKFRVSDQHKRKK